jgi:hypothetical protein
LCNRRLPRPRLVHPYPGVRFDATHPRQEPYALEALVRICAGGGQRWPSLPRPIAFRPVTGLKAYEAFSVSRFKLSCSSDLINV